MEVIRQLIRSEKNQRALGGMMIGFLFAIISCGIMLAHSAQPFLFRVSLDIGICILSRLIFYPLSNPQKTNRRLVVEIVITVAMIPVILFLHYTIGLFEVWEFVLIPCTMILSAFAGVSLSVQLRISK